MTPAETADAEELAKIFAAALAAELKKLLPAAQKVIHDAIQQAQGSP